MNSISPLCLAQKALPALSGSSLTYNAEKELFTTLGYTSAAGNTYFKAIRISDRLAVYYDIGIGYKYTFLNGITLFAWNGQKANIIAQKYWDADDYCVFSESYAREQSIKMLGDYLKAHAKAADVSVGEQQLMAFARQMIAETQRRQLE